MLDPAEAEKVIRHVARKLQSRFRWLDQADLEQDARLMCATTDVLTSAADAREFNRQLWCDLVNRHETEEKHRREIVGTFDSEGHVAVGYTSDGDPVFDMGRERHSRQRARRQFDDAPTRWRGTTDEDYENALAAYEPPEDHGRSQLLDRLARQTKADFMAEAEAEFGAAWAKKRDLRTLLYGHGDEAEGLWVKYAKGKRLNGLTKADRSSQEQMCEVWRAYPRSDDGWVLDEGTPDADLIVENPWCWHPDKSQSRIDQRALALLEPRPLRALSDPERGGRSRHGSPTELRQPVG